MAATTLETSQATDKAILTLWTENEARSMYNRSPVLKNEYPSIECFIGYWKALQAGRARVLNTTPAVNGPSQTNDQRIRQLENEAEAKAFWDSNPNVREEFGTFGCFRGYWESARAGLPTAYGFGRRPKNS